MEMIGNIYILYILVEFLPIYIYIYVFIYIYIYIYIHRDDWEYIHIIYPR